MMEGKRVRMCIYVYVRVHLWHDCDSLRVHVTIFKCPCARSFPPSLESLIPLAQRHSDEGRVFSWGRNARMEQALPDSVKAKFEPFPWDEALKHHTQPIAKAACGLHHTLLLDASGRVLGCGANELGQLGRAAAPETRAQQELGDVLGADAPPVAALVCGKDHALAVTRQQGQLWGWGAGMDYQLGNTERSGMVPPQPLGLDGVHSVATGWAHTVALVGPQERVHGE